MSLRPDSCLEEDSIEHQAWIGIASVGGVRIGAWSDAICPFGARGHDPRWAHILVRLREHELLGVGTVSLGDRLCGICEKAFR